ncbi:MAG TPA: acyltransferase [Acidimicrobiales bacterium]|jgi:galactoside O-acetyltransferase
MEDGPQLGVGARIFDLAKIVHAENLSMGKHTTIDDFVFLNAGRSTRLGDYVHIACHASVIGGGELEVGDYGVIATGARILTATDTCGGGARMSTHLPDDYRNVVDGKVCIRRDAFVGANAVVMPGVTIGEGAVAGAGSVVTHDLDPWTIYAGVPARSRGPRQPPSRPVP